MIRLIPRQPLITTRDMASTFVAEFLNTGHPGVQCRLLGKVKKEIRKLSMRRKSQLVLVMTVMVAALVSFSSCFYISQILRQQIVTAHDTAAHLTLQMASLANNAVPDLSSPRPNLKDPAEVRRVIASYLKGDSGLNTMLESTVGASPTVYDAAIVDANGTAILHSNSSLVGRRLDPRPDFQKLQDEGFRGQLRILYSQPAIYEVRMPLELNGAPFGSIRLGISMVFLRKELTPLLQRAVIFSGISILLCLALTVALSCMALGPKSDSRNQFQAFHTFRRI